MVEDKRNKTNVPKIMFLFITYTALHRCVTFCDGRVRLISRSANHTAAKNRRKASRQYAFSCVLLDDSTWHKAFHSQEISMGRFYPRR